MKTSATIQQLNEALNFINQKFDDNIQFKEIKQISAIGRLKYSAYLY
jgi:hypothetical protein